MPTARANARLGPYAARKRSDELRSAALPGRRPLAPRRRPGQRRRAAVGRFALPTIRCELFTRAAIGYSLRCCGQAGVNIVWQYVKSMYGSLRLARTWSCESCESAGRRRSRSYLRPTDGILAALPVAFRPQCGRSYVLVAATAHSSTGRLGDCRHLLRQPAAPTVRSLSTASAPLPRRQCATVGMPEAEGRKGARRAGAPAARVERPPGNGS